MTYRFRGTWIQWQEVPCHLLYSGLGLLLSAGAPLGLLVVRGLESGKLSLPWALSDLAREPTLYLYVSISTSVVFTLFGFSLGLQADRLMALSATDPLTGLRNRRALFSRLGEEFARAIRYGEPLSLLIFDVDRLKEINDAGGHGAGDAALRRVATAVRRGSRATDFDARLAGDEFALLAPNTGTEAAVRLAERIRSLVPYEMDLHGTPGPTVSVGVATLTRGSPLRVPEALIRAADEALYEAKRKGRNRVVVA